VAYFLGHPVCLSSDA